MQKQVNVEAAQNFSAPKGAEESGAKKRRSLKPLVALSPYMLKHKPMIGLAVVALVVSALATLSLPIALRRMIDQGFSAGSSGIIDQYFLALILVGLVLAVAGASRFFLVNWLGERVVADVRRDVFSHLSALGPDFFDATHSGELMSRLTADTTQIKSAAGSSLSQAARNVIMLLGALAMMLATSLKLSSLVLVAIPAIVVPLLAYGRVVRRLSRRAQDEVAEASAYASENLGAVRTMQAFGAERVVAGRYGGAVERAFVAAINRLWARAGLTMITVFLVTASIVGVLWLGSSDVVRGTITGGTLSQFVLYAVFAGSAMAELSEVWGEISQAAGAAERLGELLSATSAIASPLYPVALPNPLRGEIEFKNVSFAYPSRLDDPALSDISFTVKPGARVAVVGPSGAGKTTLFGLLLRFQDATKGQVLIDGVPTTKADLAQLRRHIALVPQDVVLFADTVSENIRYGEPSADLARVVAAAKAAEADGFIRALPQGYDTKLGEHGIDLSGGQRQRIAIARAILKDAPILLLDEATSALDAGSEVAVQSALEPLMKGRTTLVIAHRLATVTRADLILVLEKGRIVERGTHGELIAQGGVYRRLADLQLMTERV